MKRRFADARGNKDIIKSRFKNYYISNNEFIGNIGKLEIYEVANIWYVDEEKRCILNKDYTWLEFYPEDKNYCMTAICNEKNEIIEWYFDICIKNGIEENVPYEDDLFLDIVIVPDGRIHILDEDELLQAYQNGEIDKNKYKLAYNIKDEILQEFKDIEELNNFTNKYIRNLL